MNVLETGADLVQEPLVVDFVKPLWGVNDIMEGGVHAFLDKINLVERVVVDNVHVAQVDNVPVAIKVLEQLDLA